MKDCIFLLIVLSGGAAILHPPAAFALTMQDVPGGPPKATVDLATTDGVRLVNAQWRYSDTKIIEVEFRAPGPDGQPGTSPIRTYDYTPHASEKKADGCGMMLSSCSRTSKS